MLENNDFCPYWLAILFVSFRFDLFRFISICFVSFRSVSFRFDLFRFVSICFVSFRFVSVSFRTLQGPVIHHYQNQISLKVVLKSAIKTKREVYTINPINELAHIHWKGTCKLRNEKKRKETKRNGRKKNEKKTWRKVTKRNEKKRNAKKRKQNSEKRNETKEIEKKRKKR